MSDDNVTLLGVNDTIKKEDGKFYSVAEQHFDPSFWAGLQWAREQQTKNSRCKEFHKVASIPAVIYHKWLIQGHNPFQWTMKELMKKLYEDDLTAFITTSKRVI